MKSEFYYHQLAIFVNRIRTNSCELASLDLYLQNTINEQEIMSLCTDIENICIKLYPLIKNNVDLPSREILYYRDE